MDWEQAAKKLRQDLTNMEQRDEAREAYVIRLKERNIELREKHAELERQIVALKNDPGEGFVAGAHEEDSDDD